MKKLLITSACMATLLMAAEASAQGGGMGAPGDRPQRPEFSTLDKDANGFLSVEELNVMRNGNRNGDNAPNIENIMSRMDTNSDSLLSEEEFSARPNRGQGGERGDGERAE